jgi:hypothetical protein
MKPKLLPPLHQSVREKLDAVLVEPLPDVWLCILERLEDREPDSGLHSAMVELQLGVAALRRQVSEMRTLSQIARSQLNASWALLRRASALVRPYPS